jgi:hypothetical protein
MRPVVWTSEPSARALTKQLEGSFEGKLLRNARSMKELVELMDPTSVAFVDSTTLPAVASSDQVALPGAVIAICDHSIRTAIAWFASHPWLSHIISSSLLESPLASGHLKNVMSTFSASQPRLLDWMGSSVRGRRIRLTHASKRVARLERLTEFMEKNGVGQRTIEHLRDAAEELLTNAFYDAPVAAGAMKKPVSRMQDIALPDDSACDIAYGCREDLALVRVRDPFGSLSRRRIIEVLTRCASTDMDVKVDESMGGAGLGLWRIFTGATFVGVSVVKNHHTEFLVGIATKRTTAPRPFGIHFFFKESGKRRFWKFVDEDNSKASLSKSITILSSSST